MALQDTYNGVVDALSPVGHWMLNETGTVTTAANRGSAADADMSVHGTVTSEQDGPAGDLKSFYFDGSALLYEPYGVPVLGGGNLSAYTVTMWFNLDSATPAANSSLFSQRSPTAQSNVGATLFADGHFAHDEYPPSNLGLSTGAGAAETGWGLFAIVKGASRREIWWNNSIIASDTSPETFSGSNINQASIMGRAYNNDSTFDLFTAGYASNVAVFSSALSASDLGTLYTTVTGYSGGGGLWLPTLRRRRRA